MNRAGRGIALLLLAVVLALGGWWLYERYLRPSRTAEPGPPVAAGEDDGSIPPVVQYPVPEPGGEADSARPSGDPADGPAPAAEPEPLPPLAESDRHLRAMLGRVFAPEVLADWLIDERIVERLVVTINSLDGPSISLRFWPVEHIEGLPLVERDGDRLHWSPHNAERYRPLVEILQSTDPGALADVYFRNYPLFQQAWQRLGVEPAHFNDRLVEIVDHLLGAPAVGPTFEVRQPKVLYEFADPQLEAESWGRKLLMRMGPENAKAVKQWLRELRTELVRGAEENGGTANGRE